MKLPNYEAMLQNSQGCQLCLYCTWL